MQPKETLRFAGDVTIEKVQITSQSGFYQDVSSQVIGIQIFEDLLSPFITGTLVLKDSLDLANLFPFVGEEYLHLKLRTPTLKVGNIDQKFYIYKMTDRQMNGDRSVVYQLHFIAQEALIDMNKAISKTFSGKVSDIAKTLMTDRVNGLQIKTNYVIEETSNSTKYVSNFWSPIRNLIYLLENSKNKTNTPSYVFFQNRDGYNFVSLETLYKQQNIQQFKYDNYSRDVTPNGSVMNPEEDYKRILGIRIPQAFDYMDRIQNGFYGSRQYTYDIVSKKRSSTNYDMLQNYKSKAHLNENPPASSKVVYRYNSKITNEPKYYNNFSNFGDVTNTSFNQERTSLLKQAESTKIEITVPGRFDYTVGRRVFVKLNKVEPVSKNDKSNIDNMFSGNYIVSAINHFISHKGHECTLELIKDSLLVNLDGKK